MDDPIAAIVPGRDVAVAVDFRCVAAGDKLTWLRDAQAERLDEWTDVLLQPEADELHVIDSAEDDAVRGVVPVWPVEGQGSNRRLRC